MSVRLRYLLILLLFIAIPPCSAEGGDESTAPATPYVPPVSGGVQRVELTAGSYFYKPEHIVVRVGIPVEFSIRKEKGITPHTIEISEPVIGLDINEALGPEPVVVRFTPTRAGRYDYYCAKKLLFFKSHRAKGMKGVLEVVE